MSDQILHFALFAVLIFSATGLLCLLADRPTRYDREADR